MSLNNGEYPAPYSANEEFLSDCDKMGLASFSRIGMDKFIPMITSIRRKK